MIEENQSITDSDPLGKPSVIGNPETQPKSLTIQLEGAVTFVYELTNSFRLAQQISDKLKSIPNLNLKIAASMHRDNLNLSFADRDFVLGRITYTDLDYYVEIVSDTILHELEGASVGPIQVDGPAAAVEWTHNLVERLNQLDKIWGSAQVTDAGAARAARCQA